MNCRRPIASLFCLCVFFVQGQKIIRGTVVEKDSNTVMPFVYIINKSNGNGTMSDNDGKFLLGTSEDDTLMCSYVGYMKLLIPVKKLKADNKGDVMLVMSQMYFNLNEVTVSTFKIKPYEREYMNDIIDRSKVNTLSYFQSPISALYMRFSKEGRQINKLAQIFEKVILEEQVQKKLSREILVRLTKDEKIDYEAFRKYCYYVNDYYIVEHDGVELYSRVMDCYKRWKSENGNQPGQERKYRARDTKDAHRAREEEGVYRAH
jgi:hypothetical protein